MRKNRPIVDLAIEIDERLSAADHAALARFEFSWIKTTRLALGWTSIALANKMSVSQQSVSRLEERKSDGSISIQKLSEVADAMNCRLMYGFVPNQPMSAVAGELYIRQQEALDANAGCRCQNDGMTSCYALVGSSGDELLRTRRFVR